MYNEEDPRFRQDNDNSFYPKQYSRFTFVPPKSNDNFISSTGPKFQVSWIQVDDFSSPYYFARIRPTFYSQPTNISYICLVKSILMEVPRKINPSPFDEPQLSDANYYRRIPKECGEHYRNIRYYLIANENMVVEQFENRYRLYSNPELIYRNPNADHLMNHDSEFKNRQSDIVIETLNQCRDKPVLVDCAYTAVPEYFQDIGVEDWKHQGPSNFDLTYSTIKKYSYFVKEQVQTLVRLISDPIYDGKIDDLYDLKKVYFYITHLKTIIGVHLYPLVFDTKYLYRQFKEDEDLECNLKEILEKNKTEQLDAQNEKKLEFVMGSEQEQMEMENLGLDLDFVVETQLIHGHTFRITMNNILHNFKQTSTLPVNLDSVKFCIDILYKLLDTQTFYHFPIISM